MSYRVDSAKVVREHFADETILINMDTCVYYSLNEAAREAFKLLEAGLDVESTADALVRDFEIDVASVPDSVRGLLDELIGEGLMEPANGIVASPPPMAQLGAARKPLAAPEIARYTDMQELLLLDPIHDVDATGWPVARKASQGADGE